MKWMNRSTQYRNKWSDWYIIRALLPHECRWCGSTFWFTAMWRRAHFVSNWGGSMWLYQHECIACSVKMEGK